MYRIVTEPSALADITEHYRYLVEHAHSPDYPDVWFEEIERAILGLGDFPLSFGRAPEGAEFEEEIRHRHARQDVLRPNRDTEAQR